MNLKRPNLSYTPTSHESVVIKKVALKRHLAAFRDGGFAWWTVGGQLIAGLGLIGNGVSASKSTTELLSTDAYKVVLILLGTGVCAYALLQLLKLRGPYGTVEKALKTICDEQEGVMTSEPVRPASVDVVSH